MSSGGSTKYWLMLWRTPPPNSVVLGNLPSPSSGVARNRKNASLPITDPSVTWPMPYEKRLASTIPFEPLYWAPLTSVISGASGPTMVGWSATVSAKPVGSCAGKNLSSSETSEPAPMRSTLMWNPSGGYVTRCERTPS